MALMNEIDMKVAVALAKLTIRRVVAVLLAATLVNAPQLATAEPAPSSNYGPIMQVQEYLTASHRIGELVAVSGFPLCSEVDECRLLAGRDYVSPRVLFSAIKLEKADQTRLLHCLDPEQSAKPCIVVLYGEAIRGRSVAPHRVEWRAFD